MAREELVYGQARTSWRTRTARLCKIHLCSFVDHEDHCRVLMKEAPFPRMLSAITSDRRFYFLSARTQSFDSSTIF